MYKLELILNPKSAIKNIQGQKKKKKNIRGQHSSHGTKIKVLAGLCSPLAAVRGTPFLDFFQLQEASHIPWFLTFSL